MKPGGEEPDCNKCLPPLLPENEDAIRVFVAVQGQVITAGEKGKVVDIDHSSIHASMVMHKVRDRRDCFDKVVTVFHTLLTEMGEE